MDFQKNLIKLNESLGIKEETVRYCGRLLFQGGCVGEDYIEAVIQRDNDLSVCMGNFIATPHGTDEVKEKVLKPDTIVIQIPGGVNLGAKSNSQTATVLFGIVGVGSEHLEMIQKISIFRTDVDNVVKLVDAQSRDEIIQLLNNME